MQHDFIRELMLYYFELVHGHLQEQQKKNCIWRYYYSNQMFEDISLGFLEHQQSAMVRSVLKRGFWDGVLKIKFDSSFIWRVSGELEI